MEIQTISETDIQLLFADQKKTAKKLKKQRQKNELLELSI